MRKMSLPTITSWILKVTLVFLFNACSEKTGVCTACCSGSGTTYCKDDWTEEECKDWNDKKVNGLNWNWHEGQTCAGRGTPATP